MYCHVWPCILTCIDMNHLTIWVPNFDLYPWWLRMWGRLEIRMLWGDQQGAWTSHHSETVIQMMMSIMINNMMIMMMVMVVVVMMMVMMVIKTRFGAIPVFCCCLVFWPHTTLGQGTFALYVENHSAVAFCLRKVLEDAMDSLLTHIKSNCMQGARKVHHWGMDLPSELI